MITAMKVRGKETLSIIGAGAWGTAMAISLSGNFEEVTLWSYCGETLSAMKEERENRTFLPGYQLPSNIHPTGDLKEAVLGVNTLIFAVPSQHTREVAREAACHVRKGTYLVSLSKGIETKSLKRVSEVLYQEMGEKVGSPIAVLSGPTFAKEVAARKPAAATIACSDLSVSQFLQRKLSTPRLRLYADTDVTGVEVGGAVKNVIAIATGIADGIGFGYNARAAIITRGLTEITRMGIALGAEKETFQGLAGIGDLILTCTGDLSRNRTFGFRLGQGERAEDILGASKMVVEGVKTSQAVHELRKELGVEMPIAEQVHQILYKGKRADEAVEELLSRSLKIEKE